MQRHPRSPAEEAVPIYVIMRFSPRPLLAALSALAFLSVLPPLAAAQGGPPFRSDDPETPESRHVELNLGITGDRNPGGGVYQAPVMDLNYGLGSRAQIRYILPFSVVETRPLPANGPHPLQDGHVLAGLGESLVGVKFRFYQHHPGDPWLRRAGAGGSSARETAQSEAAEAEERGTNLAMSIFPQITLNNPTHSVGRGIVPSGPDVLLPLELSARFGPLQLDGEAGYHLSNSHVPQSWSRGLIVGHEFTRHTKIGVELYSQQEANEINGEPKKRETTLGLGGRQALNRRRTFLLMAMGGRSFQGVSEASIQPSWFAYVGVRMVFGPAEKLALQMGQKQPGEDR